MQISATKSLLLCQNHQIQTVSIKIDMIRLSIGMQHINDFFADSESALAMISLF